MINLKSLKVKSSPSMKRYCLVILIVLIQTSINLQAQTKRATKPNIILILADDLGYGELGSYGQTKIETPNLDKLAHNGMRFTQFYAGSPVCAPSRYMLLTGKHPGHAEIRGNDEWGSRGDVWDYTKAVKDENLEGQRPYNPDTMTLAEMLKKAGYNTGMVGKWGLGAPNSPTTPNKEGFDFFYGYNCQRQAHQLYPKHLWKNEKKVWLENELVPPHQSLDSLDDIYDLNAYAKYDQKDYGPALMHQEALKFIAKQKNEPFFLYYASPLPHLPLQVPKPYVDKYVKLFGDEKPYNGKSGYFPHRYPNAAYAGMISYLDDQIGELLAQLKKQGIADNTLIIFTSDNGPTYTGGVDASYFNSTGVFQNAYGRTKGFVYEGGIRVPLIAYWPEVIKKGTTSDLIGAFWDVMPTLAQLVNENVEHTDGLSFLPTLNGLGKQQKHDYLYWEFPAYHGQQAVRINQWKAVRQNILEGQKITEIYNLETDPQEKNNLAKEHPNVVKQMDSIMSMAHEPAAIKKFKMPVLGD